MSYCKIDPRQSFGVIRGKWYFFLNFNEYRVGELIPLNESTSVHPEIAKNYLNGNHRLIKGLMTVEESGKTSLRDKFPLLYKSAEELDVECFLSENDLALLDKTLTGNMSEEEFKRCKKGLETSIFMNEVAHSKRTFAKLASTGFCVTQRGEIVFAEGTGTVRHEETTVTGKKGETLIKCKSIVKPPEVMMKNRVRKSTDEGQGSIGTTTTKTTVSVKVQQQAKIPSEALKPQPPKKAEEPGRIEMSKVVDVDALVELIEGTHIKTSDPKKAAKKARQKEKKEMERQRIADDKAKEEKKKKQEELEQLELERKRIVKEKRRLEDEERKRQDDIVRKQKEAADVKKEEQRRKREEIERRKTEEKKMKKDAKKQRREQRKKELEGGEDNEQEVERKIVQDRHVPIVKTEPKRGREDKEAIKKAEEIASEKDFGRIKHEKEQRKREEEEARRLEQLQAHERAQANKKNKKKKQKHNSESNSQSASDGSGQGSQNDSSKGPESSECKSPPVGAPILDLLNASSSDSQGKGGECNNLVTIKKHMDSTVTISMKGKEGEKDLIYTLMNGQVYPTNNDGRIRSEDALPLQQTAFVKPETVRPNHIRTPPATINNSGGYGGYATPVKAMGYSGHSHSHNHNHSHSGGTYPSPMMPDHSSLGEIDLSQLKLPPGITITKVPQHLTGLRGEDMNGMQHPDFQPKQVQSSINDYARISSMSGLDTRYNPNVMVVDSRCSSLESPVIGIRPSDAMYGANGTRPSSEASVASDRPNSGMDSVGHNGMNPYAPRPAFHSNEMLHARVPISLSSPFASTSRNETPSPGWPNDYNSNINGMPGMIPSTSAARPDGQGFWSSTPASPVGFPANSVTEILRAQDQQFKFRNVGFGLMGEGSSQSGFTPEAGMMPHKSPAQFKQGASVAANPHSYAVGSTTINLSSSPRVQPYSSGIREVTLPPHPRTYDQWSPWDPPVDTSSPDASASPSSTCQSIPLMKPPQVNGDSGVSWEPALRQPQHDKQTGNRTVNPYGPIGSNISRRSSSDAGNGISQNGKPAGPPRSNDAAFWSYNRTF